MRSDYCFRCGSDSFDNDLNFDNDLDFDDAQFDSDNNLCNRCGETLWEVCSLCNGTVKAFNLPTSSLFNRCDQCGRPLRTQNQKCSMCNGTGKRASYHVCIEPFQM